MNCFFLFCLKPHLVPKIKKTKRIVCRQKLYRNSVCACAWQTKMMKSTPLFSGSASMEWGMVGWGNGD